MCPLNRSPLDCPTTNEVFVSLLVYLDRMSRLPKLSTTPMTPLAGEHSQSFMSCDQSPQSQGSEGVAALQPFAVDSFNVHRLLISGITVASKFFSDIFYTNSRYAKVGGLPLAELNALELQFLLLNSFDLPISLETLTTYFAYLTEHRALPPLSAVEFPQLAYMTRDDSFAMHQQQQQQHYRQDSLDGHQQQQQHHHSSHHQHHQQTPSSSSSSPELPVQSETPTPTAGVV